MNREKAFQALGDLDDRFVAETVRYAPEEASGPSERIVHMKPKRIITLALAAALVLSFSIVAYAGYNSVATPQAAEQVALEQIEVWKELGILSPELEITWKAHRIEEIPESTGNDYWYGRWFPHSYEVMWNLDPAEEGSDHARYSGNFSIDTLSGRIMTVYLFASPDGDRPPVDEIELEMGNGEEKAFYYYDNFDDIFPADLTLDQLCERLADYWGFTGYTLSMENTTDETWQVDGSTPVVALPATRTGNERLLIFFEGDQEGAPMYLQLTQFPGYVGMSLGTSHAVG